jgi:protein-S-isoprenylcysteine O-methyltransferase Ste14
MHALFGGSEVQGGGIVSRIGVFIFGLVAYAMFFATITYAIGFVSGLVVPKTIDSGTAGSVGISLLINAAMLMLFVVQHTIMARPAFKRWWTRIIPQSVERSIFVALASAILMLTFWQWRPVPYVIWDLSMYPIARYTLLAISLAGWAIVFLSSFMVSHFDLFGLRQVWLKLRGRPYEHVEFRLVGFYKLVRHPLMVGFLIAFWATPTMTIGHLFFATLTTLYIVFGTWIEERDLLASFGDTYRDYQQRVRAFVPIPREWN